MLCGATMKWPVVMGDAFTNTTWSCGPTCTARSPPPDITDAADNADAAAADDDDDDDNTADAVAVADADTDDAAGTAGTGADNGDWSVDSDDDSDDDGKPNDSPTTPTSYTRPPPPLLPAMYRLLCTAMRWDCCCCCCCCCCCPCPCPCRLHCHWRCLGLCTLLLSLLLPLSLLWPQHSSSPFPSSASLLDRWCGCSNEQLSCAAASLVLALALALVCTCVCVLGHNTAMISRGSTLVKLKRDGSNCCTTRCDDMGSLRFRAA